MNELFVKLIGKKVKIFIRGLANTPVFYTCVILSVEGNFLTIREREGKIVFVSITDIIQVQELD
jgi:hypothetical protein